MLTAIEVGGSLYHGTGMLEDREPGPQGDEPEVELPPWRPQRAREAEAGDPDEMRRPGGPTGRLLGGFREPTVTPPPPAPPRDGLQSQGWISRRGTGSAAAPKALSGSVYYHIWTYNPRFYSHRLSPGVWVWRPGRER